MTYDFDSETDGCVTVRDRDTMEQVRIPITELADYTRKESKLNFSLLKSVPVESGTLFCAYNRKAARKQRTAF